MDWDAYDILTLFFSISYLITILFTAFVIILEDNNAIKTISWIIVVILLPVLGMILYLNFGRNFRKEKLFSRKGLTDYLNIKTFAPYQLENLDNDLIRGNPRLYEKKHIMRLLLNNSKALLTQKNKIQILHNGTSTFHSILGALELAKNHIHLEYYIYEDDEIGNKIAKILADKAGAGVEVRFIYDDVGSWGLKKKFIDRLKHAGIQVYPFMPVKLPMFTHRINYRNHRKILVVDGTIGYVGGINVADKYIHGEEHVGFWRDTHVKLEGDAVHSLQAVFLTDWYFVSQQSINDPRYFSKHSIEEEHLVQITASGPDSDWASIMQAYFTAIGTADQHIYISTPYFIPNESILTALKTAALSGIDVKILLPGRSDLSIHLWSSMSFVGGLLRAGVEVYTYQKGFNHGKILMVDGIFGSVGTANMDLRSFDKNFEVNALIYDEEAVAELERSFLEDLRHSTKLELEEFTKRPLRLKIRESMARMISPLF
ncbi:MAG: cardiolipin synthase [Cytophagales bacterium]|nr:cardiolipin synthase [Cytophagales bacterium]